VNRLRLLLAILLATPSRPTQLCMIVTTARRSDVVGNVLVVKLLVRMARRVGKSAAWIMHLSRASHFHRGRHIRTGNGFSGFSVPRCGHRPHDTGSALHSSPERGYHPPLRIYRLQVIVSP